LEEARDWIAQSLEFEASEQDLLGLKKEIDAALLKKGR
jgi:translocation protein SEC72